MATAVKRLLSGSTDGRMINVAANAATGTTIHVATSATTIGTYDEIWLYAVNHHTANVLLTIEFGLYNVADTIPITIPFSSGLFLIVPGMILQNGWTVTAYAATANVISIGGYVNRISD